MCDMWDWSDANTHTRFERDDVIVSSDQVMVKCGTSSERQSSSLQKGIGHSAVPWTGAEKHRCHCLSNAWVCTCVLCACVCLHLLRSAADAPVSDVLEMCP